MKEIDLFLSQEFISFSEKIKEIIASKEEKDAKFKLIYEEYKKEDKALKEAAEVLKQEFENWKNSKLTET